MELETNKEIIALELGGSDFGIGNTPDEAFSDLKDKVTYHIDIEEVIFYEAFKIKVEQKLYIVEDGN